MQKRKELLLLLAATSVGMAQATPPVHIGVETSNEEVVEKGQTFVKGRVIDSDGNPIVGIGVPFHAKCQDRVFQHWLQTENY